MNCQKFSSIIISTLVLVISSCGNAIDTPTEQTPATTTPVETAARVNTIKDMYWLAGWWQNNDEGISFEEWKVAENGSLSGTSGYIKGKDTIISETISLEQHGDTVMYIPTVKDQNNGQPVPFKLTNTANDSFVFENPLHDFPNKITYKKLSATSLAASISGKMNGEQRSVVFPMTKMR